MNQPPSNWNVRVSITGMVTGNPNRFENHAGASLIWPVRKDMDTLLSMWLASAWEPTSLRLPRCPENGFKKSKIKMAAVARAGAKRRKAEGPMGLNRFVFVNWISVLILARRPGGGLNCLKVVLACISTRPFGIQLQHDATGNAKFKLFWNTDTGVEI